MGQFLYKKSLNHGLTGRWSYKKSLNMGPVFSDWAQIFEFAHGPIFQEKSWRMGTLSFSTKMTLKDG